MPVARRIVDVAAAANASATNGSSAGSWGAIGDGGTCGSGSTTCSPAHSDSNPAASAAWAVASELVGLDTQAHVDVEEAEMHRASVAASAEDTLGAWPATTFPSRRR